MPPEPCLAVTATTTTRQRPLLFLVLLTTLLTVQPVPAVTDADLDELLTLRNQFNQVDQLLGAIDGIRPWDRDGLSARIDQIGIGAIKRLNVLAERLLPDAGLEDDARRELTQLMQRSQTLVMRREVALEHRAAAERETIPKFQQSPEADIARAFIQDLSNLRRDYFDALVDQVDIRRRAGLEFQSLLQVGRERFDVLIQTLSGQVRLDALSIRELLDRLSQDPRDEDLKTALQLVRAKQERSLQRLDRAIAIGERLELEMAEQRALLIRERGQVGIELLQRDVILKLWQDEFDALRSAIAEKGPDLLFRLLIFVVILALAWLAARIVRLAVRLVASQQRLGLGVLVRDTLISLSGFLVILVGFVIALAMVGVSLGPVFAGLGVAGILVGLAVQDSLSNLAAGAMILIHRPFDIDDHIKVAGADGVVKRMNWLATTIHTFDNEVLIVPNRRIWGDTIVNFTANRVRRVDIKINFAYAEDSDRVRDVLLDVLRTHDAVLPKPEPQVHLVAMEESSVAMVARPWVKTADYWTTLWDLNRLIKQRFDAEGIEIPFPQRVVTLRNG